MVQDDGDNNNNNNANNNVHGTTAYANALAHTQPIDNLNQIFQKFNIGASTSQTQARPMPPTSPNQQPQDVILTDANLHQQIDALTNQQSAQARPISLGSSVLVQGQSAQSNTSSSNSGQSNSSQILNHSNNQARILSLPPQVVVPEQVLKQNNSGSTLSTNTANGGQSQQGLIPNLQQTQTQQQQNNTIPNPAAN